MGRIRTIKPEFFLHEGLFDLELETGLPIRVSFAGLWTVCDREGRFKWRPRQLKTQILPYDELEFSRVLDALMTRAFIVKYTVDGVDYGYVPGFLDHQVINNREKESSIPKPNENNELTRAPRVDDATVTPLMHAQGEGKGKERKGSDANPDLDTHLHEYGPLADRMWERIQPLTNQKSFNRKAWASDLRKIIELDGYTESTLWDAFAWANEHDFWAANILSPAKLRKQLPTITAQRARAQPKAETYAWK